MNSGETMWSYAKRNNIPYGMLFRYVDQLGLGAEEAVEWYHKVGGQGRKRNRRIYYYKDVPLIDFCRENNVNYQAVLRFRRRTRWKIETCVDKILSVRNKN
jgi:hypothetical protein